MSKPWVVAPSEGRVVAFVVCEGETIAIIPQTLTTIDIQGEGIARANVIAAAPELRAAWEAGRVTIPSPDFLEWVADRCMYFEGLDPDGGVELDYAVRLRAMAKAGREAITKATGEQQR